MGIETADHAEFLLFIRNMSRVSEESVFDTSAF